MSCVLQIVNRTTSSVSGLGALVLLTWWCIAPLYSQHPAENRPVVVQVTYTSGTSSAAKQLTRVGEHLLGIESSHAQASAVVDLNPSLSLAPSPDTPVTEQNLAQPNALLTSANDLLDRARARILTVQQQKGIHFDSGGSHLLPENQTALNEIVAAFKQSGAQTLTIVGHTSHAGDASYNQKLSEARAQAVRDYLVQQGLAPNQLQAVGYGASQPLADNTYTLGRRKNRRIEFILS